MIFLLKITRSIYNTIAGSGLPSHLACGVWLGLVAGLAPIGLLDPLTYLILFLILCTRSGFGVFLLTGAVLKPLMLTGAGSAVETVGFVILERLGLQSFWESALNAPGLALLGLDRYAAMGGVVLGLVAGALLFFPIIKGVEGFRNSLAPRLNEYRLVKWLRGFWLVRILAFAFTGRR